MPPPRTILLKPVGEYALRELVHPIYELLLICKHCHNAKAVSALDLIAKEGPDAKIETLRFKVRCSRCGRRRAAVKLRSTYNPGPLRPMGAVTEAKG
jgi:hypothetical protein